jgi:hypothetical protein
MHTLSDSPAATAVRATSYIHDAELHCFTYSVKAFPNKSDNSYTTKNRIIFVTDSVGKLIIIFFDRHFYLICFGSKVKWIVLLNISVVCSAVNNHIVFFFFTIIFELYTRILIRLVCNVRCYFICTAVS